MSTAPSSRTAVTGQQRAKRQRRATNATGHGRQDEAEEEVSAFPATSSMASATATAAARGHSPAPPRSATSSATLIDLSNDDSEDEEEEVQYVGITPGHAVPGAFGADLLLHSLFPPPPVRHRAGTGRGAQGRGGRGDRLREYNMYAPLLSQANNLLRLILERHGRIQPPNRGASNETIAALPTHVLPRKSKAGKGKKRKHSETEEGGGGGGASTMSAAASPAALASTQGGGEEAEEALGSCTICMEDYKGGEKVCTLPCTHAFHYSCCKRWLKTNAICCVCRAPISTGGGGQAQAQGRGGASTAASSR